MKRRAKGYICLCLAVAAAIFTAAGKGKYIRFWSSVSILFDLLTLNYILFTEEQIWGFKKRILKAALKLTGFITNAVLKLARIMADIARKIAGKLSLDKGRAYSSKRLVKDYQDEEEKLNRGRSAVRFKKRQKRYKNMDNTEKIRFLYEKKLIQAMKKGISFTPAMTPLETEAVMRSAGYMKESQHIVIDGYHEARYNDRAEISDSMVDSVKKALDNP